MSIGIRLGSSRAAREIMVRMVMLRGRMRTTTGWSCSGSAACGPAPGMSTCAGTSISCTTLLPARRSWVVTTVFTSGFFEGDAQRLEGHGLHHEQLGWNDVL